MLYQKRKGPDTNWTLGGHRIGLEVLGKGKNLFPLRRIVQSVQLAA
jgi:hypothetical protein